MSNNYPFRFINKNEINSIATQEILSTNSNKKHTLYL
jgi:hypothetical protein